MTVSKNETKEQRARYYKTWYSKPGSKELKAKYKREVYHYRKSLGMCPIIGCNNDPRPGRVLCDAHCRVSKKSVE